MSIRTLFVIAITITLARVAFANQNPKVITAELSTHHKTTKIIVKGNKTGKLTFTNTDGKKRQRNLKKKDIKFIGQQLSRLPSSKINSSFCDSVKISITTKPKSKRKREVCISPSSKRYKPYIDFMNLLHLASRR